ncbi:MAG: hypothetical protein MJ056_02335 [Akkermansia sp.]|nr:hypothetical protein [Akkermansia sp.]
MRRHTFLSLLLCPLLCAPAAVAIEAQDVVDAVVDYARRVMYPQAPISLVKAVAGMVFIGGMADEWTGIVHNVANHTPWLPIDGEQVKAYHYWHMGDAENFDKAAGKLAERLQAFRTINPAAPLVLVGHSLGASTALQAAAKLDGKPGGPVYLVTLDPVDRLTKPVRPQCVTWWGNCYIVNSQDARDVIPQIGGRWNACKGADVNIRMDGRTRDDYGYLYQHGGAMSMFFCKGDAAQSLYLQLCDRIKTARR